MIVRAVLLFALAGLAEIGGGYLMRLWLREGRPLWVGLIGALVFEKASHIFSPKLLTSRIR